MTEIEQRIRESLARTAQEAPTVDEVMDRAGGGRVTEKTDSRPRWRGGFTGAAVAAGVAVIIGAVAVYGPHNSSTVTSPLPGPIGDVTVNPSHRPDIQLCESLATKVGNDAALQRAVTLPIDDFERWLASQPAPTKTLAGAGLSTSAASTSICVYATAPIALDAPPAELATVPGQILLAQTPDAFALGQSGNLADLVHQVDSPQRAILKEFERRPAEVLPGLPPWRQPCPGAHPTSLAELSSQGLPVRLSNTALANDTQLTGLYNCSYEGLPEIRYGTIKVYFETGWKGHDWPAIWKKGLLKHEAGWYTTTFGNPTLVLHPVNGSFGEVMYVENGILMRVLGDGSVPALELLNVVRSSHRLTGDK